MLGMNMYEPISGKQNISGSNATFQSRLSFASQIQMTRKVRLEICADGFQFSRPIKC